MTNAVYLASLVNTSGYNVTLQGATVGSGTGVAFPATQNPSSDPNTLDDYEEGTWTPTVNSVNLGAVGRYTKIGRLVNVSFGNQTGVTGFAVNAEVNCSGLPFSIVGGDWSNTAPVTFCWNRAVDGYSLQLGAGRIQSTSVVALSNKGSATTTTGDPLNFSLTYFTT